ncbi:MAG: hypothetical protein U5L11_09370 [Arhodomonas sp.]|nr:hypothetical protein [Arhodomonas sp.]
MPPQSVSARPTLPRRFFEWSWTEAFTHLYAQPAVWEWLGYSGPPQPRGFPDHHGPPGAGSA